VVFDSDAYPLSDFTAAVRALFADPRLAIAGFRTVDGRGRRTGSHEAEPGLASLVLGQRLYAGWSRLVRSRSPVCIYSCAMAVRKSAFEALGGLDQRFDFLDLDTDLSMRTHRAGWQVVHAPALVAFHVGSGSPQKTGERLLRFHGNRWRLLRKFGKIRHPRLARASILGRLGVEWLALRLFGGLFVGDPSVLADKIAGRRRVLEHVRRHWRWHEDDDANAAAAALPSRQQPCDPGTAAALTLGAVVTSFDSWPLAARCVEALGRWSGRLEKIVVIDDGSPSPPAELPAESRLAVLINPARRGFAAALNRGIAEVGTDLAVIFDADAWPLADVAAAITAAFAREPRLGLLGFRTVDAAGRDTPSSSPEPGAFALLAGQRLHGWLRRLRPVPEAKKICLHTAALALRREAFLAVGGADEELGFLTVDLDLSMRLRGAGWLVRQDPALVAYHEGGGSRVAASWRLGELYRSSFRLLRKHGRIRFPRLLRTAVLARLGAESLLLATLGRVMFRDANQRRDKILGRRELIRLVRRELR
jgi:GT2 family glycosyltransferase